MSPELVIPIIASLGWLIVCGAALASHRLQWGQMARLALIWIAIFAGLFVVVEWFMVVQGSASSLAR